MCGIAGLWGKWVSDNSSKALQLVKQMTATLAHRGPDGDGFVHHGGAVLGHRRLSIIDLEGGQQPLFNEQKTIAAVVNGEIYGYKEIQQELLQRGHQLRTKSDSEVLIHLWEERRERLCEQLNGEFAGALVSSTSLFLFRDWCGVKPLYYRILPTGCLAFCSELAPLKDLGPVELNAQELRRIFLHEPSADKTIFNGIFAVPPGTVLEISLLGKFTLHDYRARLLSSQPILPLKQAFSQAVKDRLVADVPVGVYLSGGLDSNTVLWEMIHQGVKPKAYSISFADAQFDERPVVEQVAKELGIDVAFMVCQDPQLDLIPYLKSVQTPAPYVHGIAKWQLSRFVRDDHTKVVLTGEGADELFCGYQSFVFLRFALFVKQHPRFRNIALKAFEKYLGRRPPQGDVHLNIPRWLEAGLLLPTADRDRQMSVDRLFQEKFLKTAEMQPPISVRRQLNSQDELDLWREFFIDHSLAAFVLVILGDRVEMAHSVEARTPFLDPRVLRSALAYSGRQCVIGTKVKNPIRQLPRAAALRDVEKRMFYSGLDPVLNAHRDQLRSIVDGKSLLFKELGSSPQDQMVQLQSEILVHL